MENVELLKRLSALVAITEKDSTTRYALSTVRVYASKERRELVAAVTDGHRLIEEKLEHSTLPELLGTKEISFSRENAAAAKLLIKDCGKYLDCSVSLTDKGLTFSAKHSSMVVNIPFSDCEYPDYKRIVPEDAETRFKIAFNARYLYEIAKALHNGESKSEIVTLSIDKSLVLSPIIIRNGNTKAKAVLMPCRI